VRVFLACVVDDRTADRVWRDLEPMRRAHTGAAYKWVPPANYHVTLRFFGELDADQVDRAVALIAPIVAPAQRFEGRVSSAQALPNQRRPNVIVLPIESAGRLEALAAECNRALNGAFGPPDKPFKAHLTVIRCRRGARFVEAADVLDFRLTFTRVALFESTAGNGAPKYTALREFALGE
jgi:2'-5' RNA ligase